MEILDTIFLNSSLDINGKAIRREAVRAIIRKDSDILMVYSNITGDYKFPGGGINENESHEEALVREINEECGIEQLKIIGEFGKVIEYDKPIENEYEIFKMTSYYYICKTNGKFGKQKLDNYEKVLGLSPKWIEIEKAIQINKMRLEEHPDKMPKWVKRDTKVIEML